MKERKAFLLYNDLKYSLDHLTNEQAGILFKNVLNFVNGLQPNINDQVVKLTFEPIKQHLLRNSCNYIERVNKGLEGSLKRWHKDIYKLYEDKKISFEEALSKANLNKTSPTIDPYTPLYPPISILPPTKPPQYLNDNDSVNDNDSANDNVNVIKVVGKEKKPTILKIKKYFQKKIDNYDHEAEKFFAYNNAGGWKNKNGKAIENWQSLADLWILSEEKFKKEKNSAQKEKEFDYEAERAKDPRLKDT